MPPRKGNGCSPQFPRDSVAAALAPPPLLKLTPHPLQGGHTLLPFHSIHRLPSKLLAQTMLSQGSSSFHACLPERHERLKPGDKVTLELDEGNQVIDIEKGAVSEQERTHAAVTGEVLSYDRVKKEVTLKVKTGEPQSFMLKDAAATKMNAIKPGTRIVLEVDEENKMGSDFELQ